MTHLRQERGIHRPKKWLVNLLKGVFDQCGVVGNIASNRRGYRQVLLERSSENILKSGDAHFGGAGSVAAH